jgi:hypothetical protein
MRLRGLLWLISGPLLLSAVACKVESLGGRSPSAKPQSPAPTAQSLQPSGPLTDDAQLLLQACGKPRHDQVVRELTDLHRGLVRNMLYDGRQPVTFELTPSQPAAAPTPGEASSTALPPGAVWRFSDARMEDQTLLTARDLAPFLPCARRAFASEY